MEGKRSCKTQACSEIHIECRRADRSASFFSRWKPLGRYTRNPSSASPRTLLAVPCRFWFNGASLSGAQSVALQEPIFQMFSSHRSQPLAEARPLRGQEVRIHTGKVGRGTPRRYDVTALSDEEYLEDQFRFGWSRGI